MSCASPREGLRNKLAPALAEALKGTIPVTVENVQIGSDGNVRAVDLIVQPILEPGETQRLMMIVFRERTDVKAPVKKLNRVAAPALKNVELETLKQELIATNDHLQNTIEELETANEEFQSTNEELQSANEELETSKEELQSTNEELVTVNSELQHKIDQLTETSNDVNNLLASTEIASVFGPGTAYKTVHSGDRENIPPASNGHRPFDPRYNLEHHLVQRLRGRRRRARHAGPQGS